MAAYHQYYAVNRAVESTLRAADILPEASIKRFLSFSKEAVNESPESYGLAGVKKQPVVTVKAAGLAYARSVNRFRWFSLPANCVGNG